MKKLTLCYLIILLMSQITSGQLVKKSQKLTATETKVVQEIALKFNKQVAETGDISSIIDEFFADDFIERFIKEKKREITKNKRYFSDDKYPFVTFLYFRPDLLDEANSEDWKRLYISTFNFKYFDTISVVNELAKDIIKDKKLEWENLVQLANKKNWYPPKVFELFENHPNLKGRFLSSFNSEPIKTVEELQNTNVILEQGFQLLKEEKNGKFPIEISEEYKKLEKQKPYFGAKIVFNDVEFFGFPKGTKFISVWVSNGYNLYIVKVKGEYKVLLNLI